MTSNAIKIFRWRIDSYAERRLCMYKQLSTEYYLLPSRFFDTHCALLVKFQCKTKQFDNFGVLSTKYSISVYCVPNTL